MAEINRSGVVRTVASVALVGAIIWWAGASETFALLGSASLAGIALLVLLHAADRVLMAYKWWRLLRARGYPVGMGDATRGYFLASFVGAVLPVAGGADLARIAAMRGKGAGTESLTSSVALERAIGAISHGLFCLAAIGLAVALSIELDVSNGVLAVAAATAVVLLTLCLPLTFSIAGLVATQFVEAAGFRGKIARLAADYAGWSRHPRELWIFLALTFIEGFYPIVAYYAAAWALGVDASLVHMAIAVPLAFLLARLPIPLPSLGPEQGMFIFVATQLGMSQDGAAAITLLFLGTLLIAFAPGAVLWMSSSSTNQAAGPN